MIRPTLTATTTTKTATTTTTPRSLSRRAGRATTTVRRALGTTRPSTISNGPAVGGCTRRQNGRRRRRSSGLRRRPRKDGDRGRRADRRYLFPPLPLPSPPHNHRQHRRRGRRNRREARGSRRAWRSWRGRRTPPRRISSHAPKMTTSRRSRGECRGRWGDVSPRPDPGLGPGPGPDRPPPHPRTTMMTATCDRTASSTRLPIRRASTPWTTRTKERKKTTTRRQFPSLRRASESPTAPSASARSNPVRSRASRPSTSSIPSVAIRTTTSTSRRRTGGIAGETTGGGRDAMILLLRRRHRRRWERRRWLPPHRPSRYETNGGRIVRDRCRRSSRVPTQHIRSG
jgi:hypothetical protein